MATNKYTAKASEIHDYTHRGWGHDYAIMTVTNGGQQLAASGWGRGIETGHFLMFTHPEGGNSIYKVDNIRYSLNPSDMWFADLSFVNGTIEVVDAE